MCRMVMSVGYVWRCGVSGSTAMVEKWGEEVAGRGFAQIPNYLLLLNQFLEREARLSPVEMLVLIQLVGGWWKREDAPFPSMATLATRCAVSDRQILRAINKLVERKILAKTKRRNERGIIASNAYDLSPLVEMLQEVAKAFPNEFPRRVRRTAPAVADAASSEPSTPPEG